MDQPEERSIRDVVGRAADKDPDAWEWLYRRSYGRLHAYALRRTSDPVAAEEAVSETMTRALERIRGFEWRGAGFDGWLFGILRNVVLEHHRSAGRDKPMGERLPEQPSSPDQNPAAVAERTDRRATLREAFEKLSADDRELLELRVVGELSSDEAAEVIGKNPGAVRMAQARALDRLRAHLEVLEGV